MTLAVRTALAAAAVFGVTFLRSRAVAQTGTALREGKAAFGDWHTDSPGTRRLFRQQDLPAPDMAASATNFVKIVRRSDDRKPIVPNGFEVNLFASGLSGPRQMRVAPNGECSSPKARAGRIVVLRPEQNGRQTAAPAGFASGLRGPFGIACIRRRRSRMGYVGNTDSVVRFPYRNGDVTARAPAAMGGAASADGGHSTRDLAFSPDGATLYVSVGSEFNVADRMEQTRHSRARGLASNHPLGAAWDDETERADVLAFDPTATTAGSSPPVSAIASASPSRPRRVRS